LATFAELLGARLPADAGEDSFSLVPDLYGEERSERRAPVIHHSGAGYFAVRDGRWKLLLGRGPQGKRRVANGQLLYELYDLERDPGEQDNLAKQHPAVVEQLVQRITELVEDGRSNPGPKQANHGRWWPQLSWIKGPAGSGKR
jgi:arylsulfatase A